MSNTTNRDSEKFTVGGLTVGEVKAAMFKREPKVHPTPELLDQAMDMVDTWVEEQAAIHVHEEAMKEAQRKLDKARRKYREQKAKAAKAMNQLAAFAPHQPGDRVRIRIIKKNPKTYKHEYHLVEAEVEEAYVMYGDWRKGLFFRYIVRRVKKDGRMYKDTYTYPLDSDQIYPLTD